MLGTEPDAGRVDDMALHLSFDMVQGDTIRELLGISCPTTTLIHSRPQILFLNKNDLFEEKVPRSDVKRFFPVFVHFFPRCPADRVLGLRR